MSRTLKILAGLMLSGLFIYFSFRQINLGDVRARGLHFSFGWLLFATILYSAGVVLRGIRWRMILASSTYITIGASISLVVIGMSANNILPMRTGEIVRSGILNRQTGMSTLTVLGTILLEKILDTLVLLGLLVIALVLLNQEEAQIFIIGAAGIVVLGINLLFVLVNGSVSRRVLKLIIFLPDRIRTLASGVVSRVQSGFGTIQSKQSWLKVVALSILIWVLESISYFCLAASVGIFLSITHFAVVTSASNLAIAVPSTSGGIGPFEFFAKESLTFVSDISVTDAAVYAVVLHFLLLAPVSLVGLFLAWIRGLSILRIPSYEGEAEHTK
ncbi:MAG: lysylphosphatidylglycerol synthase transmembrane domain-containing protein [Chloroflexota bacterium]|nr:lysylphosphatidylglycerol synthase transmembrane domain-containing protein [Chloroflexota bacterium]